MIAFAGVQALLVEAKVTYGEKRLVPEEGIESSWAQGPAGKVLRRGPEYLIGYCFGNYQRAAFVQQQIEHFDLCKDDYRRGIGYPYLIHVRPRRSIHPYSPEKALP